jgi:Glycosyl hydrolases family 18
MTRRGGQLPWGQRGAGGLYGSQPKRGYGRLAIMALIVIGVLGLGYLLFTKLFSGASCDKYYCESGQDLAAPAGYELVTRVFEFNTNKAAIAPGTPVGISLPVAKTTADSRNLSFYQYLSETKTWEPVTAARLDPQGKEVSATLTSAPKVMAVLRRISPSGMVIAYLPHNGTLHHDAVGKITMLHTLDFTPAADGGIDGEVSTVKVDPSFQWIPTISARADVKGQLPIVQGILNSPKNRSAHVQAIAKKVADANLAGIDIEYLDLTPNERTSFALFIGELSQVLHAQNKQLTVTLPPPLKAQDRIDEGGYDWAEIGKAADIVQLAPYRDQGRFRTDMPAILQYLSAQVQPSTRLVLTVTPYAAQKDDTGVHPLRLTDAMSIAGKLLIRSDKLQTGSQAIVAGVNVDKQDGRSGIAWVPEVACVAFTYEQNGGRTVWLENFFSIGFKLQFISQYGLGGVAVEDASDDIYLGNIWTALVPYISSGQPVLMQPNPQDLQPKWATSKGTFEDSRKGDITWSTPAEPGTYTITLTLSDGVSLFQSELPANVQARDKATPAAGSPTPGG